MPATKLKAFLDENEVEYLVLKHHERYTSQEIAEALHVPGRQLAKVVLVNVDGGLAMAVLPADLKIDMLGFAEATGSESAELATEQEFESRFPDCELGAMPPFGNLYDIPVYVDRSLEADEKIVFEAGNHKEAIQLAYEDFRRLVKPEVADFARR